MTTTIVPWGGLARVTGWVVRPLVWLERARGWRRRLLVLAYAVVALLVGGAAWWSCSLNGLPDIGDPFDVEAFASFEVPPDEDAFVLYRQAAARLTTATAMRDWGRMWRVVREGWSKADEETRGWVDRNREALALWRRGTERPLALAVRPGDLLIRVAQPGEPEGLMQFNALALLEGSRREEAGDMAGAWGWYAAALRASRHVGMHGDSPARNLGLAMATLGHDRIAPWAADPRTDAAALRLAGADLREVIAMTGPNSEAIKGDYLALMHALEHPEAWMTDLGQDTILYRENPRFFRLLRFLKREPERGRRVARILVAHWLAHADDPPSQRPKMVETRVVGNRSHPDFPYHVPPGGLDAAHPLTPDDLYGWYNSSLFWNILAPPILHDVAAMDRERRSQAVLLVTLAEQCYLRERGTLPEAPEALVAAGYLDRLPDGYASDQDSGETPPDPEGSNP